MYVCPHLDLVQVKQREPFLVTCEGKGEEKG